MKTIDAVIEQCEEIANASKQHTLHMTHFSQSYDEWAEEWTQIAEWLKELKAYKENTCGDAISREAVLNAMYELCSTGETLKENPWRDNPHIDAITDVIENLPSITPQQRTGRWIQKEEEGEAMTREEALSKAIMTLVYFQVNFCKSKEAVDNTQAIIDTLEQIEQEPKWIPVWERLPEKRGDYLVTQKATFTDYVYISVTGYALNLYDVDEYDFADKKRSGWYEYDSEWGYRELDDVIAWMPLPQPYKVESEVQE